MLLLKKVIVTTTCKCPVPFSQQLNLTPIFKNVDNSQRHQQIIPHFPHEQGSLSRKVSPNTEEIIIQKYNN